MLWNNNYWFEKKMYKLANPLLQELIENGSYKITEDENNNQLIGLRMTTDLDLLALDLFKNKIDIKVFTITILDNPPTQLRMNQDEEKNKKILANNIIFQEQKYELYKKSSQMELNLLKNYNYIFHSFYNNKNAINFDIFIENSNQYKNKIFSYYLPQMSENIKGAYWIMKYKNYYYLCFENALQADSNPDEINKKTRYFIWKKLTFPELMQYHNQLIGKFAKENGIKFD